MSTLCKAKLLLIPILASVGFACSRGGFDESDFEILEPTTAEVGPFVPISDSHFTLAPLIGGSPMVASVKSPSILSTPEDTGAPYKIWYEIPPEGFSRLADIRFNPIEILGQEIFSGSPPSSIGLATARSPTGEDQSELLASRYTDQGIVLDGSTVGCDLNDPDVFPIKTSNGTALLMFLTAICDENTPEIHLCFNEPADASTPADGKTWSCVDGDTASASTFDPIIPAGSAGTEDAGGAFSPSVIRDGDKLRMIYTGWNGDETDPQFCLLHAEADIQSEVSLSSQAFTTAAGWTPTEDPLFCQSEVSGQFDEKFVGYATWKKDVTELNDLIYKIYYTGCTRAFTPQQSFQDWVNFGLADCSIGFAGSFDPTGLTGYTRRSTPIINALTDTVSANLEEAVSDILASIQLLVTGDAEMAANCDEFVTNNVIPLVEALNLDLQIEDCADLFSELTTLLTTPFEGRTTLADLFHLNEDTPDLITVGGTTYLAYRTGASFVLTPDQSAIYLPFPGVTLAQFTP